MANGETFTCANRSCHYVRQQPIENVAQELDGFYLCKDCRNIKMLTLKRGVIVETDYEMWNKRAQDNIKRIKTT